MPISPDIRLLAGITSPKSPLHQIPSQKHESWQYWYINPGTEMMKHQLRAEAINLSFRSMHATRLAMAGRWRWRSAILILVCISLTSTTPVHLTSGAPNEVGVQIQTRVSKDAAMGPATVPALGPASGNWVIVVDQSGAGDFMTISEAVDAVPSHNQDPITIQVNPGTYEERVVVPKDKRNIILQGAGRDVTKITSGIAAVDTGTTYSTSTFGVSAPYFTARNISFENSSQRSDGPHQQAVALRTTGDFNAFYGCAFYGNQDTLYDDRGRHYFRDCLITGSVDFIFGNGKSLYENCELRVLATSEGYLTAQKRSDPSEETGFSFVNCQVTGSGPATVYLGRTWGAYSRVMFAFTELSDIINPVGWYTWGDPSVEVTAYYGQYKCLGPGANESGRVTWSHELTDAEAAPFVSLDYIDGDLWVGNTEP